MAQFFKKMKKRILLYIVGKRNQLIASAVCHCIICYISLNNTALHYILHYIILIFPLAFVLIG